MFFRSVTNAKCHASIASSLAPLIMYYVTLLYYTKSCTLVNYHRARRGAFGNDVQFGFLSFAAWLAVASIFVR